MSGESIASALLTSFSSAARADEPYPHWILEHCLPDATVGELNTLPFGAPALNGLSGKREVHNATRTYFDRDNIAKFPVCAQVCEALASQQVLQHITDMFHIDLAKSYLRVEYAQDIDGFWLQPHTDLGVKLFTMLLYISTDESHADLGTDIYTPDQKRVSRSPFRSNSAMVFVPGSNTFHGFEQRPIHGVRKSVIINYVTDAWMAREQLAYPETPISLAQ